MEAVAEAARKARYNEIIVVNVTSDEIPDESREIVLTATLDEDNGGVVWHDAGLSANGILIEDVGIVRHLRTKRWVLPMLNDTRRNELFDDAIRAASLETVRRFKGQELPSKDTCIHALDIGTGTGLLAMMTSKHLQSALDTELSETTSASASPKVQVTSLEMASAMARLAKLTIESNNLQGTVNVLEEHSCEANLDQKFMMCTSELLESGLLGEGILPSLRDAWQRHLHPNAVMVPRKARVFAQLVESCEVVGNSCGPHSTQSRSHNDSCSLLRLSTRPDGSDLMLSGNVIVPIHAESLFTSDPAARVLTDAAMVMEIDFSREKIPGPEGRRRLTSLAPTASGVAHGVLFWWELDLWDNLSYSTEQGKEPWQDHWQQCLFVFGEGQEVRKGEDTNLVCSHTDDRLCFALESSSEKGRGMKRSRIDEVHSHSPARLVSPERALQLNDQERLAIIRRAMHFALEYKGKDAHFLDISDFSLCAILGALEGATFVSSLETSSCDLPMAAASVSEANGLPRIWNGKAATYQILQCGVTSLTIEAFNDIPAEIVAAEPYYEVLEGWHLLEALNYYYLLRSLRECGFVKESAISIPSFASILVCGIQCESLAKAYQGCGDDSEDANICGFMHSAAQHYGDRYHQNGFTIRACEYEYTKLTETREISRLCYGELSSITGNNVERKLQFESSGTCHGVLYWVEYGLQVSQTEEALLSTNNREHRQLFQLVSSPAIISQDSLGGASLVCRLKLGGLDSVESYRLDARVITNE